jgi:hypothetical protein
MRSRDELRGAIREVDSPSADGQPRAGLLLGGELGTGGAAGADTPVRQPFQVLVQLLELGLLVVREDATKRFTRWLMRSDFDEPRVPGLLLSEIGPRQAHPSDEVVDGLDRVPVAVPSCE